MSSRAKSNFLSNMSHDIRTPMNAIVGYTALAKKEKDPKKVADYMNKIDASSHHLLALINDVLDMSRVESGKMELELAPANLVKTLDEVRDLFATQMKTKKLVFTVTADVTNRTAICDKNRLNRILLNLLSNAFKFTPEGGSVSVKLIQTGAGEDMGYYQLRVKDTGIGMSPEFAATMFDAFTRERTAEVAGIQGTGLGMAITKSIVDLMGGEINVITEKDKGTEFVIHLTFPLAEELPEEGEIQESGAAETDSGFAGMRILLVEDQPGNCPDDFDGTGLQGGNGGRWQDRPGQSGGVRPRVLRRRADGYPDAGDERVRVHESNPRPAGSGTVPDPHYCNDGECFCRGYPACIGSGYERSHRQAHQYSRYGGYVTRVS